MTVLITGASGFLGSNLLETLLEQDFEDEIYTLSRKWSNYKNNITCDLLDFHRLKEAVNWVRPTIVYHLAGNGKTQVNNLDPSAGIRDNIEATNNLLSCLPNCPKFIFTSSVTVFGKFRRDFPANFASPTNPISQYATSKLACENLVRIATEQGKVRGLSVRLHAIVGKYATHGLLKDVVEKLQCNLTNKLNLIGKSPGSIKPFALATDVCKKLIEIADRIDEYGHLNHCIVGNRDSLSVERVAEIAMQELEISKICAWSGESWPGDNNEIWINPDEFLEHDSEDSIRMAIREMVGR